MNFGSGQVGDGFRFALPILRASALNSTTIPKEVIVVVDRGRNIPSVIPHEDWLTLDYNATPVVPVFSPEDDDTTNWKEYNPDDRIDFANFSAISKAFEAVANINPSIFKGNLFSLAGIQSRLNNSKPGSQNQIFKSPSIQNYLIAFGGQASTSALDAIETCNCIRSNFSMKPVSRLKMLQILISNLSAHPIDGFSPMRWQKQT